MSVITIPTSKIALGNHLSGTGAVLAGSSTPYAFFPIEIRWPNIAENQYIPDLTLGGSNDQTQNVSGFGDSLFFEFETNIGLAGGIQAFMANSLSFTYGEIKIPRSKIHNNYTSIYVSNCGTFNPRSLAGVLNNTGLGGCGRFDIYWDYLNNYSSGFEIVVNSKSSGRYRGISDQCGVSPSIENCSINGNGPDGTPVSSFNTYFSDGGTVSDLTITIPWNDINNVTAIFVHFIEADSGGGGGI
jgi:hypothetical protein